MRIVSQMVWKAAISNQNGSEHGYTKPDFLSAQNTTGYIYIYITKS